ncbi:MAG: TetR/AcrR family transcriptional regulator [Alphaproteobacteria bacterium]
MSPTVPTASETSERILDIAEQLVQTHGFNGFSYADIAAQLGITKASLHYHFPTKATLGERLVERYQRNFLKALADIDEGHDHALQKLKAYVRIYRDVLEAGRMCLCGMLAAEHATLPEPMRDGVRTFFAHNESWLAGVLSRGRTRSQLAFAGKPVERARFLVGALEGAMLLARSHGDVERFRSSAATLLAGLAVEARPRGARED